MITSLLDISDASRLEHKPSRGNLRFVYNAQQRLKYVFRQDRPVN